MPGIGSIVGERSEEPGERDLRVRGVVSFGDLGERVACVAAQREVGDEDDALVGAVVDDVLVPALREAVVVLHGGYRHDCAGLFDLVDSHVRDPDMPDLAGVMVLLDRGETVLERRLRVGTV